MHQTHVLITEWVARDRAEAAQQRAAARRFRTAAGTDLHTAAVTLLGAVADRLRADDLGRRARAEQVLVPRPDGTLATAGPA